MNILNTNQGYSILGMFIRVQGLPKILCCEGIPSSPSGGEASEVLQWLTWRYRWDDCGKNRITVSHFDIMVICPSNGGPICMFSSLSFQMDGVLGYLRPDRQSNWKRDLTLACWQCIWVSVMISSCLSHMLLLDPVLLNWG